MAAAEIESETFKAEFIAKYLRNWKLKTTLKKKAK